MYKHQILEHGVAPPDFVMIVVGSCRSALSRQTREAVQKGGGGELGAYLIPRGNTTRATSQG